MPRISHSADACTAVGAYTAAGACTAVAAWAEVGGHAAGDADADDACALAPGTSCSGRNQSKEVSCTKVSSDAQKSRRTHQQETDARTEN